MVTNESEDILESVHPFHEIRRAGKAVMFSAGWTYWVLFMPFDGQFHDVSHYKIQEEHMKKFCHRYRNCYNTINYKGKVILC